MSTPLELFIKHMDILKNEYVIVKEITKKKGEILICFDDGFKGIYDCKSYFIKNNIKVHIFLISSFIGKENYLNKEQILDLNTYSNFTFGAHTDNHVNLGTLNKDEITSELVTCKNKLEDLLSEEITDLCFPRGSFSNKVIALCKEAGYNSLYSSIPGNYFSVIKKDVICRNLVQHDSPSAFKQSLNGAQNILTKKRLKQHFNSLN
ncbi:polysaccharide deacetylase family protein [Winogradskyella litorisediminis]|uniref:Polysaccharide deacetylase family protein n=1 Tax=Winogradskyella litorisediminis TaxID=1156618 RepID=A0ABW3N8K5_9FLAO